MPSKNALSSSSRVIGFRLSHGHEVAHALGRQDCRITLSLLVLLGGSYYLYFVAGLNRTGVLMER